MGFVFMQVLISDIGVAQEPAFAAPAKTLCKAAQALIERGAYQEAAAALGPLWQGVGVRPLLEGYGPPERARILLLLGLLATSLGDRRQQGGAQEAAKDLLSESAELFALVGLWNGWAETQAALAGCYFRAGAIKEAKIIYSEGLRRRSQLRGVALVKLLAGLGVAETYDGNAPVACEHLEDAAEVAVKVRDNLLRGKVLQGLGFALQVRAESDPIFWQQALDAYKKARQCYRKAGNTLFMAGLENSLGLIFLALGNNRAAHYHFDQTIAYGAATGDKSLLAGARDSKARAYLASGQLARAEHEALLSVAVRREAGGATLLSESLRTLATIHHRQGEEEKARRALQEAYAVTRQSGDLISAGLSLLQWLEDLALTTPLQQAQEMHRTALELLKDSSDGELHRRLHDISHSLLEPTEAATAPSLGEWQQFSLSQALRETEANYIRAALQASNGGVTRAAKLLGMKHQTLSLALKERFPELAQEEKTSRRPRQDAQREKRSGLVAQVGLPAAAAALPAAKWATWTERLRRDLVRASHLAPVEMTEMVQ
jgi:tetratricopeptide (TPR) repeat protein